MKDRNIKQVLLRAEHLREERVNEEGKGGEIWLMGFLHMYKYRILKSVEVILGRGRRKRENDGRDETN
jgi:hypothetical protein